MLENLRSTRLQKLPWTGAPKYLALQGAHLLAISEAGEVYVARLKPDGVVEPHFVRSFEQAEVLALSPSGRYLLVFDARATRQIMLWDVQLGVQKAVYGGAGERPRSLTATFATVAGREVLLLAQRRFELSACYLEDMREIFSISTGYPYGFHLSHLITLPNDRDFLFVVGHQEGEGRDALLRVALNELVRTPEALLSYIKNRAHFYDYSYRIFIGPGPGDSVALFRDPEDAEEPGDYDEGELLHDVECFQGIYIRRLSDGYLLERIPYTAPPLKQDSGYETALYATETHVLVSLPGRLDIVARHQVAESRRSISGQLVSLDASSGRCVLLTHEHELLLVDLVL